MDATNELPYNSGEISWIEKAMLNQKIPAKILLELLIVLFTDRDIYIIVEDYPVPVDSVDLLKVYNI